MREFDSPGEDSSSPDNTPNKDPLRFKFKLSKAEEESSSSQSPGTRTCEFCGREFANGKALGGHIRIHTQAMKNNNAGVSRTTDRLKQKSNLRPNTNNGKDAAAVLWGPERSENWEKEQICRICNRTFPSVKSLFGHMRFHPERTYRGAQPPSSEEQSKTSYSTSEESDQEIELTKRCSLDREVSGRRDLLKDLPNWSRTDKRGRQSTSEAAQSLMRLSCVASYIESDEFPPGFNGQKFVPESPQKKSKLDDGADTEVRRGKCVQVQAQPASLTGREFSQMRARPSKELYLNTGEEEANCRETGPTQNQKRVRFQCTTCGRIFPTFQALGGHRSSHNKEKGTIASASHNRQTRLNSPCPVLEASASTEIAGAAPAAASNRVNKEEKGGGPSTATAVHQCGICGRSFETGQALGGHKRCHWPAVELGQLASGEGSGQGDNTGQLSLGPKDESSPGDQASQVGPRGLEIDLNKPPPTEDEDGSVSALN
ncbi:hypothetical protein CRG98_021882 [Punica granatum]|uniref:C2H2-type domain-containing protein n=1 Tax=Punica granatum TaxID=22663 RepID=A0A2I0JNF4_PUNGR|nr:hypothetical protein CRG98_021882 [Punica granatum]